MYTLNSTEQTMVEMGVFFLVVGVMVAIVLLFAVASYANKLGREATPWVMISLFITPILILLILMVIGETDELKREKTPIAIYDKETDSIRYVYPKKEEPVPQKENVSYEETEEAKDMILISPESGSNIGIMVAVVIILMLGCFFFFVFLR